MKRGNLSIETVAAAAIVIVVPVVIFIFRDQTTDKAKKFNIITDEQAKVALGSKCE